jgi:hypothetical protein
MRCGWKGVGWIGWCCVTIGQIHWSDHHLLLQLLFVDSV